MAGFVLGRVSGERKGYPMVKVLECVGEHYEAQDAQGVRVYRLCPPRSRLNVNADRDRPLPQQEPPAVGAGRITWKVSKKC